jgi:hypothetical protein
LKELDRLENTELPRAKRTYASRLADFNNLALKSVLGGDVLRDEKNASKVELEEVEKEVKKLKMQLAESEKNAKLKGTMSLEQYRNEAAEMTEFIAKSKTDEISHVAANRAVTPADGNDGGVTTGEGSDVQTAGDDSTATTANAEGSTGTEEQAGLVVGGDEKEPASAAGEAGDERIQVRGVFDPDAEPIVRAKTATGFDLKQAKR